MNLTKAQYWHLLRTIRNKYLSETDKFMLADFPIDTKTRAHYREYRQYLRDLPKMYTENAIHTQKVKNFQEWKDWKNSHGEY